MTPSPAATEQPATATVAGMADDNTADRDPTGAASHALAGLSRLLVLLWILWAVFLLGGFAWGWLSESGRQRIPLGGRMGSSVVLVVVGWTWIAGLAVARQQLGAARTAATWTAWLIASGMALGAVGDFFNAGLLETLVPLPNPVLGGIGAFGLGHISYIAGCVVLARRVRLTVLRPWIIGLVVWQAVGLIGWYVAAYRGTEARELLGPALPYSLLLAGTAGVTMALALQDRRLVPLAVGAGLFLLSDLILAFRLFHEEFPLGGDAVWLTYGPGQMLIVFSIGACVRLILERGATLEQAR